MKRCEAKEKERERAELMRQYKELAVQAEQVKAALEKEIREQWNSVVQEKTFQPKTPQEKH